ncbi:hypothetical protein [Nocardia higoensis]|uniref:hypothetical protein n=1 Tax=Nocardia higoensis TaxID=228599 RepID=UPI0002ED57BB|nr:hypothetical protein [Nocardia higoensis]
MISTGLRVAAVTAATAAGAVLGAGVAAAAPILAEDTVEEGAIALDSLPENEEWTCVLLGTGAQMPIRVDLARVGESRGGFAPGSTVTAGCLSMAPFGVTTTTGVTSLDDED